MYKLIIVILCVVIGNPPKEQLAWDGSYRLQWSDFKGQPEDLSDAVAITASGLSSTFSARTTPTKLVDYTASVVAHFYPLQSWYKPERVNEIVLAHEQLHFDITELHARKLRRFISEFDFTLNIKEEMRFFQDKINKDLEVMQERYDAESNFSMQIEAQKKWQIYIREELQILMNFK